MSKLFRKLTTKHPSTKSLSFAPGSPKLSSSRSMPAIARELCGCGLWVREVGLRSGRGGKGESSGA